MVHNWRGRRCTILAHPQTRHRFSSLILLPNCQYTVTIMQGFTNCESEHTIQSETKGRTSNIMHNTCSVRFSFQDTLHCQVAQAIEWSIHGPLSSHKRCSKQCLAWYPLQYTLICCHQPLLQLLEVLPPQDPTIKEASMPSALQLPCAKTTSALQLQQEVLHLPTECYVKWSCLWCVSVIAICRIAFLEGDCLWKQKTPLQVVVQMQLIIMKYSEDPQFGWSQLLCDIVSAPIPQRCCNTFTGWCLYSPRVTCIQVCCSCDMETLFPSSKQCSMYYHLYDAVHVPVQQYRLHYYIQWDSGACCSICHVCLQYSQHNNTAEKYVTAFDKGKCVRLLSLWTGGLSDGCSAVRENFLCTGYKFIPNVSQ
jgi:hypothetical protein